MSHVGHMTSIKDFLYKHSDYRHIAVVATFLVYLVIISVKCYNKQGCFDDFVNNITLGFLVSIILYTNACIIVSRSPSAKTISETLAAALVIHLIYMIYKTFYSYKCLVKPSKVPIKSCIKSNRKPNIHDDVESDDDDIRDNRQEDIDEHLIKVRAIENKVRTTAARTTRRGRNQYSVEESPASDSESASDEEPFEDAPRTNTRRTCSRQSQIRQPKKVTFSAI